MARSKRSSSRELRDVVFRGCVVAGLLGALLYGSALAPQASKCPAHPRAHHAGGVGECVGKSLGGVLAQWVIIIAVGFAVGTLVGLLLARLIPVGKPRATRPRPARERIPERVTHAVWRRDEGRCVECGTKENLEFDHIIPLSRGGANTERNLQLLCATCNARKAAHV